MTIKSVCLTVMIICVSFVCGIVALIAGQMIALCIALLLGGAALLATTIVIYIIAKENGKQKRQTQVTRVRSGGRNARKR